MGTVGIEAPGRLVDMGGRSLHVQEKGSGPIPVVFEAGIAASSLSCSLVQPRVAEFDRTISYDRAGFGWSAAAPAQSTALDAARDLARMLEIVHPSGPVLLAGHSFGGLIARIFQQ